MDYICCKSQSIWLHMIKKEEICRAIQAHARLESASQIDEQKNDQTADLPGKQHRSREKGIQKWRGRQPNRKIEWKKRRCEKTGQRGDSKTLKRDEIEERYSKNAEKWRSCLINRDWVEEEIRPSEAELRGSSRTQLCVCMFARVLEANWARGRLERTWRRKRVETACVWSGL